MYNLVKGIALGFGLAFSVVTLAAPMAPAHAEQAEAATFAFVDVQRIMHESAAAKSIRSQLERQGKAYEAEINAQSEKLAAEEDALKKQRASLSPDSFATKQREFQGKVEAVRRQVERRRQQLAFAQEDALKKVQPVFNEVVSAAAKEFGASIVLDTSQVLVSSNALNITDIVMRRMDEKLPSVTVNFNAPAGSGTGAPPPPPLAPPSR